MQIIKQKAFNNDATQHEEKPKWEEDEYKHIRNTHTRKAIDCLRQARRCEQFAYRLELIMKGTGKEAHAKLNKDALYKIDETSKEDEHWEVELASKLVHDIENQVTNVLLQPMLKRCAKNTTTNMTSGKRSHKGRRRKESHEI